MIMLFLMWAWFFALIIFGTIHFKLLKTSQFQYYKIIIWNFSKKCMNLHESALHLYNTINEIEIKPHVSRKNKNENSRYSKTSDTDFLSEEIFGEREILFINLSFFISNDVTSKCNKWNRIFCVSTYYVKTHNFYSAFLLYISMVTSLSCITVHV